jgi:hypothetical protein
MSSVLTPRSHPIDIMTPPGAPKKPYVPTLYRSDSYDVEDFLAEVSNYNPANATITSVSGDTEDTASSRIEKSGFYSMILKFITSICK